ncbi:alpha/beta hydrolase [Amycolatopsis taiwanensis]|uniref:alpha/beta hydrolase n=1 Tax=Amycolatopsis taiwanensis TaxID=342230 RepID=UPI00146FB325|nr:alpha/beta hydrolase [Amycolatopsis taiwanensis]
MRTVNLANLPDRWREAASMIKSRYDGTPTGQVPPPPGGDGPPAGRVQLPHEVWFCQDWRMQVRDYAEWSALSERLARSYPTVQWSPYANSALDCVGYTGKTTYPQQPAHTGNAPAMMLLGNVHDFATVYTWSQGAAKQTGATLVTYEGYGHTIYPSTAHAGPSACINSIVEDYLINLKLPASGTRCPDIETPGGTGGPPPSPGTGG